MRLALLLPVTVCLFAQATDPITDQMRYEIAAAQRDYLLAQRQFDAANLRLKDKVEQAQKACSAQSATFDLAQFVCAPKPEVTR